MCFKEKTENFEIETLTLNNLSTKNLRKTKKIKMKLDQKISRIRPMERLQMFSLIKKNVIFLNFEKNDTYLSK